MDHINCLSKELRRLFLVEDIVDSIKVCETIITYHYWELQKFL